MAYNKMLFFHSTQERNIALKRFCPICFLLSLLLLLSAAGCGSAQEAAQDEQLHITATTYPLYALTSAITAGVDHVEVRRLNTGSVSCLHDYTLTVSDMRYLEQADIIVLNGAGLESFLEQALGQLHGTLLDCSRSVSLLEGDTHEHHEESGHDLDHGHDHAHEHDPHYWMDPKNMISVAGAIAHTLATEDPVNAQLYQRNAQMVCSALQSAYNGWSAAVEGLSAPYLITFHDGFHYFAEAFGLEILFSMEEEDGATASARDITLAAALVKEHHLSVIFTEENGSGSAARAVSGETGVCVSQLSMLMSGQDAPANATAEDILDQLYILPMNNNIETILEVLK